MKTVMSPTVFEATRSPITHFEIRDLLGGWYALVAFTPDDVQPLFHGALGKVTQAGEYASSRLRVPVRAACLAPRGIKGWHRVDRFVGAWAEGVRRGPLTFGNADELYRHLLHGGFSFWGPDFVSDRDSVRHRIFRSHDTLDSMRAWEVALYRLENAGRVPTHLDIPADTCPRCLSRHAVIDGPVIHCQECHHVAEN